MKMQSYSEYQSYGQYKDKPLLRGSGHGHLFSYPTYPVDIFPPEKMLKLDLDLLDAVGGNYLHSTINHRNQNLPEW